ncbi:MAG: hypothetical protein IKE53_04725 [Clostridiales bacterium]|nr:hypothetical protein [Clostridiales bacterium]
MADTIKCPNCSANLFFEPASGKLECAYCGGSFDPATFEAAVEELMSEPAPKAEAAPQQDTAAPTDAEPAPQQVGQPAETSDEEGDNLFREDAEDTQQFVCKSCAGVVISSANTSASFCPFCGSPALIGDRLTGEFKPEFLIPFKYSREQAEAAFLKWCKGGRWTPIKFVSNENISKLTGLYVPFWLFDVDYDLNVISECRKDSVSHSGSKTTTTMRYYEVTSRGKYNWRKIPFDGETRINDALMEAIEPFNYSQLIPFDYKYLPGFFADKYDQDVDALKDRVIKRVTGYQSVKYKELTKKYDSVKVKSDASRITDLTAHYALLPVWFMNYKYLGRNYSFAMNGQTGEVAGIKPISIVKGLILFLLVLIILATITRCGLAFYLGEVAG